MSPNNALGGLEDSALLDGGRDWRGRRCEPGQDAKRRECPTSMPRRRWHAERPLALPLQIAAPAFASEGGSLRWPMVQREMRPVVPLGSISRSWDRVTDRLRLARLDGFDRSGANVLGIHVSEGETTSGACQIKANTGHRARRGQGRACEQVMSARLPPPSSDPIGRCPRGRPLT